MKMPRKIIDPVGLTDREIAQLLAERTGACYEARDESGRIGPKGTKMAYPQETNAIQARNPSVASSIEDFDPVIGRLETLANRAMICGDRIAGARPSGVKNGEKNPSPSHLLWAIQSRRERLVRAVDHIEGEMARLETGLGIDRDRTTGQG